MARRGAVRAPYWASVQLAALGLHLFDWIAGRQVREQVDPAGWSAQQWLDYLYATIIDMAVTGGYDAKGKLDEQLAKAPFNDRETWGTDSAAQAGQSAMMDLFGGPAVPPPALQEPDT